ncbi:hypothetical protein F5Y13DRAFT_195081 [Hypoxylon sp. FL1857]|nr:hypothetical protein F5Y13DRAFT_195081 [Hypoxylon sp. FL1857]
MPPKKSGNGGKRGSTSKNPPAKRARKGIPDSGYHTDHDAQPALSGTLGVVLNNSLFECRIPMNERPCGSRMKNKKHNIRSHLSQLHGGPHCAYSKAQATNNEWPCTYECEYTDYDNFHSFLAHARRIHGFRGESDGLKEASIKLRNKRRAEANGRQDKSNAEDEDDSNDHDADTDDDYIPPPDRPDSDPKDDRQDPPGPSGSLPIGIAA